MRAGLAGGVAGWALLGVALAAGAATAAGRARADGGTVRFSGVRGAYRITVFTTPTPPRSGSLDVSVLVQDASSGDVDPDATVVVRAWPEGAPSRAVRRVASSSTATNKLYRAAIVPLAPSGRWRLAVRVGGPTGTARAEIGLRVAEASPRWVTRWPWVVWPVVPVAWFLLRLRGRGPPRGAGARRASGAHSGRPRAHGVPERGDDHARIAAYRRSTTNDEPPHPKSW